jgi:hypothetical protein
MNGRVPLPQPLALRSLGFKAIFSKTRHSAGMPPDTLALLATLSFLGVVLLLARWWR